MTVLASLYICPFNTGLIALARRGLSQLYRDFQVIWKSSLISVCSFYSHPYLLEAQTVI
jgi:hypothetical protein